MKLDAINDSLLTNKQQAVEIAVLENDIVHSSEQFTHKTEVHVAGNSGHFVYTMNAIDPFDYFYWFQSLKGESTFTTLEDGAKSTVRISGLGFVMDLGLRCNNMEWAVWAGGTIVIENSWGTTTYQDATFEGGIVIDHLANDFGRATGVFTAAAGALQIALPSFDGFQTDVNVNGDGLLLFTEVPKLEITSKPTSGTAKVQDDQVWYVPSRGSEGVDNFVYQVTTQLGDKDTAAVHIGTMDLDISDYEGNELDEVVEDNPGLFLSVNNDDDNRNQKGDQSEEGFIDDDLVKLLIKEHAPLDRKPTEGYFTLAFDSTYIHVWHSQDKIKPPNHSEARVISARESQEATRFSISDLAEDFIVWVEGIAWGAEQVDLTWHSADENAVFDSVTLHVIGVDVDVDSDNNGIVDESPWEEKLEDNIYALGNLTVNAPPPTPASEQFQNRMLVKLPPGLPMDSSLRLAALKVEGISSGQMELLDQNHAHLRWFNFSDTIGIFKLSDLGYSSSTGKIELFYRATVYTGVKTKVQSDRDGKPDNRIAATLLTPQNTGIAISDEVKVLIVRRADFFDSVQNLFFLRSAGAAQAVYSPPGNAPIINVADAKIFALRNVKLAEMEQILARDPMSSLSTEEEKSRVREYIRTYLYNYRAGSFPTPQKDPGFQAGLYRDYVTGGYRLAIRGTEPTTEWHSAADFFANLQQAMQGDSAAYENGILLTWALTKLDLIASNDFSLCGHSMGGGIASAAAVANLQQAYVFNAAGVNPSSLLRDDGTPIIPGTSPGTVNYLTYVTNWAVSNQEDKYLQKWDVPDILTFIQDAVSWLPDSPGNRKPIEGVKNLSDFKMKDYELAQSVLNLLPKPNLGLPSADYIAKLAYIVHLLTYDNSRLLSDMVESHSFDPSIYFGLLHDDATGWNVYDDEIARNR